MQSNRKLGLAIAAILGGHAAGFAYADTSAGANADSDAIQEITVTAQRRTESQQNVPITIQALTGEALAQLNVQTIDEFIHYVPNINSASFGPGLGDLSIRGVSTGSLGIAGTGSTGPFPNVAVYLDDQSGQLPSRNLDVYAADMERIEVLEGPQGTLFGGGAEAGVIRYITNKPKLDVTEGSVTAGYGTTAHGDPNSNLVAVLNLPLVSDALAVRGVIYSDSRGGYINNVPSTFTRSNSDFGIGYAGGSVPANSVSINNGPYVADGINPVVYQGIRLSVLAKFNEDWNLLVAQSYQHMDAKGVFYQMPYGSAGQPLPAWTVTTFNPSDDTDHFENTSWTLNGRVGALKLVYTGSYLDRNLDQTADYTNYARGHYTDYYQCVTASASPTGQAYCLSPSSSWREQEQNTHQSHELRLSTPDDWRLRAVGGVFHEQLNIYDQTDWMYRTLPGCTSASSTGCLTDIAPPPGATANNPNTRGDNVSFFDDIRRGYTQTALFGSVDYELVPKTLTLTAGTRYYKYQNTERGSDVSAFGCYEDGAPPCANEDAQNIDAEHLRSTASGFASRVNLSWKIDSDALLYYTWSQGYRPGAFNRGTKSTALGPTYDTPIAYPSDKLINNELGWKTEWADHTLQINGALYQETWSNAQTVVFDPGVLGNLTFNANGPNYRVRGLEQAVVWRVTHGLTLQGSAAWNSTSQTNIAYLTANTNCGGSGEVACGSPILSNGQPVNIYGNVGSPLAMSPPLMFNARLRYEWETGDYHAFWQVGGTHQAHELSVNANTPSIAPGGNAGSVAAAYNIPGYSTYDASAGFSKDAWSVEFFGQNLLNNDASVFISNSLAIETQTVLRPRVLGIKIGYKF